MRRLAFVLVAIVFLFSSVRLHSQEVLDRIVAIVGDHIILQSEVLQYSFSMAAQMGLDLQKDPAKAEQLRQQTLENLIMQKVMLEKARQDSVEVSDKQVDAFLEQQIEQMIQQIGSKEKLEQYFGMTLREIRREFRKDVEERLLVEALQERKAREIQITRREVEEFYETYRDSLPELKASVKIRHILRPIEASTSAEEVARRKIKEIKRRMENGESFEELARQCSQDPGSAARGGDLGMLERGDLVREFEEVAFALQPGEISDIVKTRFGFHIIKLEEKVGEKIHPKHILIRLDSSEEDERYTLQKIKLIKAKIESGELTFEEAAEKFSKDEQTASKGGDLGWFEIDQFQIPAFKEAIEGLKVGEISEPIKTRFGYHIIRLDARRPARKLNIKDDWEQIENWALGIKRQRELQQWMAELKKEFYIEVKS